MANSYSEYFNLTNPPSEINPHAIEAKRDGWKRTYPHKTFIALLHRVERMLARASQRDKHSVWIHGAYGTGKSQVAWALRSLLTCTDDEFDAYFEDYAAPLAKEGDLKTKLEGHRKSGKIVVASRYGSDNIDGPDSLVQAVFESLAEALDRAGVKYDAGKTIRGGVVRWLEDPVNQQIFELLIKTEPYCHKGCFAGRTASDILAALKGDGVVDELLKEIRRLAKERGVTALRFTKEDLAEWIKETIKAREIKALVLVWDEFSAFFKNNKTKLDTLQYLVELSADAPFNMVIVTHFSSSILPDGDNSATIIKDRFDPPVEIDMPENTAFELIGHALKIKDSFKDEWAVLADDLNDRMRDPRRKIAKMLKDVPEEVFCRLLPFHPYAALTLKNIAKLFDSNQRSMFTFITEPSEEMAFRWFIGTHDPNEADLLSVDMLWDYFYRTGKSKKGSGGVGRANLDSQVCAILDVYSGVESRLITDEQRVLKTVLMFQALAKKLNNPPEFLGTEENLRLAFDGIDALETGKGVAILNKLVNSDKILFVDEVNGKKVFQAPMAAGGRDLDEIEKLKRSYLEQTKTKELIKGWCLPDVLRLTKPLETRFTVQPAAPETFSLVLGQLMAKDSHGYQMRGVLVVGRTSDDAISARDAISRALDDPRYSNVVFIDATKNELEEGEFDKWAEYRARSSYYAKKDSAQANNANHEAEKILEAWRDRILEGEFTVRTKRNALGTVCHGSSEVCEEMKAAVLERYPLALDFTKGVSDPLFNAATKSEVATGVWGGCDHLPAGEKAGKMSATVEKALLAGVKDVPEYWKAAPTLALSKIKVKVDQKLHHAFKSGGEGRVEFKDIVELLLENGFMPTALHGFLAGFLLKEYANNDYRFSMDGESVPLNTEKLTEGVLGYFKQITGAGGRYHEAYIEILTEEQRRFAELSKTVFNLGENASIDVVVHDIAAKVKEFQYPLWCFKSLPETIEVERYVDQITVLLNPVNQKGASLATVATEIGRMAASEPGIDEKLSALFTKENALRAMNAWLDEFEDGAFRAVSKEINAADPLSDVRKCFGANGVWLWDRETGENEIRALLRDYRIVAESTRRGFVTQTSSVFECMESWRDKVRNVRMPYATLVALRPESKAFLGLLKEIASGGHLEQNERRELFYREITDRSDVNREMLDGCLSLFKATYSEQLAGLEDQEVNDLYLTGLDKSSFLNDKPTYEQTLVQKVAEIKSHQSRNKLLQLWKEKTGTENPIEWSKLRRTPILAMIPYRSPLLSDVQDAFEALNDKSAPVAKVERALNFFSVHGESFEWFASDRDVDSAFRKVMIGRYAAVVSDVEKVRSRFEAVLGDDVYGWYGHPERRDVVRKMAEAEYNLNCAERLRAKINAMSADRAKEYLVKLVVDSIDVGLTILSKE